MNNDTEHRRNITQQPIDQSEAKRLRSKVRELEEWQRQARPHIKDALEFFRAHCSTKSGRLVLKQLELLISEAKDN